MDIYVTWKRAVENKVWSIKVVSKVRKTQNQNAEFGHTQGEIFQKPAKKKSISAFKVGRGPKTTSFGGKLSFILSFPFHEHLHCCYIYFHCSYMYNYYNYSCILRIRLPSFSIALMCTTTIITLVSCALYCRVSALLLCVQLL